jgi:hypothetical protein
MRILLFTLLALIYSCTNEGGARSALEGAGYDAIQFHGYTRKCGGDDTCTEFSATGPTGRKVRGAVGCGYDVGCSKGCTIRTF